MQKLELRQNLKQIIQKTQSYRILEFFSKNEKQENIFNQQLLSIMIESKAGFDQSIIDENQSNVLEQLNAKMFYETKYFSNLIRFISGNNYNNTNAFLQNSKELNSFYTFHKTMVTSFNLVDNLLFQDEPLKESIKIEDYAEAEKEGFLSFEIVSDNEIDFKSYSIVISNINELIKITKEILSTIEKISFEADAILILADSGSNTLISIQPGLCNRILNRGLKTTNLFKNSIHPTPSFDR